MIYTNISGRYLIMKKIVKTLSIVICVAVLCPLLFACSKDNKKVESVTGKTAEWNATDEYSIQLTDNGFSTDKDYVMCIEKQPNKEFVILNLTDVQLGDGEIDFNAEFVRRADKTIEELVNKVQPDLITVTGDQGYGTEKSILYVGNLIDRYGIPWAPVFGNHDNQEDILTTDQQSYLYETAFKNCLFKSGPNNLATVESGSVAYGNYVINIVERDQSANKFHVVRSLVFVNSRDGYDYEKDETHEEQKPINSRGYVMLSDKQIAWYKWAVKGVQQYGIDGKVKSTVFLHIPIYAFNLAFNAAFKTNVDPFDYEEYDKAVKNENALAAYADKSIWNEGYENSVGGRREEICSAPYDDHVLDAIKDFDDDPNTDFFSTDMVVAGHDHVNNFIIEYEGVTMAYGLKTGSGCYYNEDLSGGSVILVRDDGDSIIYHQFTDIKVATFPWWIYFLIGIGCAIIVATAVVVIVLFKKKILPIRK